MDKIEIATILRPQGLSGELKCKLLNPNPEILKNVNEIYLEGKDVPSRIQSKRFLNGYMFLKLGTINDREKADLFRGHRVFAEKDLLSIPDDEYMISEIIGFSVVDKEGNLIGKLIDVQNYGASDIFVIEQYGREYMVPFVKEIIDSINQNKQTIIVNRKKYDEAKICE